MDRGKKSSKLLANKNSKNHMDLQDIIRESALPFLPAKSLHRCTGVCREWKLQISTPFFAHNQSYSFRDVSGFFCQSPSGTLSFVSLNRMAYGVPDPSLKFLPEPVDIRCSSNGLLCCQGRTGYQAYYICNPVTQKWKKLPEPTANHGTDPAVVLVFEPSLLNFVAEYKLVVAFASDLDGFEFEIYSSTDGFWRISAEISFGKMKLLPRTGVHVNGVVYWSSSMGRIFSFDLSCERSTFIYNNGCSSLGAVNGKLHTACVQGSKLSVNELSNAYTNTMQMNSSTKTWQAKHAVTLNFPVPDLYPRSYDKETVLFLGGDMVVMRFEKKLISYNMKTKEFTEVFTEEDTYSRMVPYVNSLVEI